MNDIAYEYDKYLRSIGADIAEEKDNILEGYFKDMMEELKETRNERKGAIDVVKDLQEVLQDWIYGLENAIDEIQEIDNRENN